MMSCSLKEELIENCRAYLRDRMQVLEEAMKSLSEDLNNETKSSAGDKYETGREMINLEWNKLSGQLNEFKRLGSILDRLQSQKPSANIALGSLVLTSQANYFISIPAGLIKIKNEAYYAVGIKSPIAQNLLGKKVNEEFEIRGNYMKILNVL